MAKTVLTAVAWPYANGPRHIGHVSGFGVPSDVFSRYQRMAGNDVLMVSGTDEHGTPLLVQAEKEGVPVQTLADRYNRVIVDDLAGLGLSYDLFTRTTTRNHYAVVQELFRGLHANGYSLVRHIVAGAGIQYGDNAADFGMTWGEALLEPTGLYTSPLLRLLDETGDAVHSLSHVTGGGIAANLARVLPRGSWVDVDRSTWSPSPVFRVLADLGGLDLAATEGTWNLGIGFFAVVGAEHAGAAITALAAEGIHAWQAATVHMGTPPSDDFSQGEKGVDGGAVRLVGAYADGAKNH